MEYEDHQPHSHPHHNEEEGGGGEEDQEDIEMPPPSYDSINNSSLTRHSKLPINPIPIAAAAMDVEPQSQRKPRYRECLKNHAVGIGAYAVDGCGEFLPAGPDGTLDALKCAACNCHRNFHRKETHPVIPTGVGGGGINVMNPFHIHHQTPPPPPPPLLTHYPHAHHQQFSPTYFRAVTSASPTGYLPPPSPLQRQQQQPPLALPSNSGGGGGGAGGEDGMNSGGEGSAGGSMKRFRTKFTAEQKERMVAFAERLGWRIQKEDEEMVQQFCNENGLKRHVLKVWMHNNKHTIGKKP